ncbi:hypothetical protein IWW36_000713 [Coemansia brasiliensis]|uniref:Uncharacterized protein n=1 Tax=Coemansia brasiliensis TaxID=2650707 RepID=A0A9W8IAT8_9FUNG|nr:hypothetical protein IWW36_000713 [Coemansia brasiliensis]
MTHREARHTSVAKKSNSVFVQSAYIAAALACFILEITTQPLHLELPCDCDDSLGCMEKPHIFSRLIYMWVTPAIDSGRLQNQYREDDLFRVPRNISGQQANIDFLADWDTHDATKQLSLLSLLAKYTYRDIIISGIYMALSTTAQLLQPLVLKKVIGFFQDYGHKDNVAFDEGLMLALGMGFLGLIRAISYQAHWHVLMKPYLWLEKVLAALAYRKTLRLSNESRSKHSTGEMASYLGVDIGILATSINYVHFVWEYPLRIVTVLFMLYRTVGYSSLVGVGLLLVNTGISARIARYIQLYTKSYVDSRDLRMQVVSETISNIKCLKLYAWQNVFIEHIGQIRNSLELAALKHVGLWKSLLTLVSSLATVFIGLTTFIVYVVFDGTSHGRLSSQLIFVSLSLFMMLEEPLSQSPTVVSVFINAARSYSRICKLVSSHEIDQKSVIRESYDHDGPGTGAGDVMVKIEDGSFKWLSTQEPTLTNVNLQCKREELVAVIGKVGAGKSSLVSAMLGDMVKCAGQVTIRGRVAYVPQQAWIVNATLRDNILFGSRFNQELYDRVIGACALWQDLEMLPGGDMTEIGEKGINLSGGQKARVSLARAVYSRADVYILDDPLAAVDAHVGKHIFTHVLGPQGMLRTRARILVTNAVQYLSNVNHIVMLRDGAVIAEGSPETLFSNGSCVHELLNCELPLDVKRNCTDFQKALDSSTIVANEGRRLQCAKTKDKASNRARMIMQKEQPDVGAVSKESITFYLRASGYGNVVTLICVATLTLVLSTSSGIWLAHWSQANDHPPSNDSAAPFYYLAVYSVLGALGTLTMAATSMILWMRCSIGASKTIHSQILHSVIHSPMSFFDSTPIGRILGLFSSDLAQVDDNVPTCAELTIKGFIQMAVAILLIIISAPLALVFLAPLSLVYGNLYQRFMPTTRDTRRMVNTMRNLCIGVAEETINGASSIRAYSCQSRFENRYAECVENYTMAWWTYLCANRWLAVRLDIISAAILFFTNLALLLIQRGFGTIDGGHVGLSLTYALSLVGVLNMCIRYTSMLELAFISIERARKFSVLPSEASEIIQDRRPSDAWPEKGMVEFKNYSTRYRQGLDLVLKDLSFRVMPNQKVGIVGRTGAGKSSLTLALFRIIEAAEGQILLDGEDISQYGLFDVRSKLSIIPQDPVLFAGTVRENLDPFGQYSDQDVWQALEHAHLADFIRTKDERLDFMVTQAGENFSVGQRQLICLARALLKRAKVLILDEATAAIDNATDTIIQESIRKEFKHCTVLTIAHRLNTIIDSDMILVVDGGRLAEYDTPQNLLENENSLFTKLVEEARASDAQ